MTNKIQKIREEVERLRIKNIEAFDCGCNGTKCAGYDIACYDILSFIDSKQDSNVKPKFKIGQRIRNDKFGAEDVITGIEDDHYKFSNGCCLFFLFQDNWELVEEKPKAKFKVGDYIKYKWPEEGDEWNHGKIVAIEEDKYLFDEGFVYIKYQDHWELVEEPKKCMYSKDNYTDKDRKVLCEDCDEKCEYSKKEEPVSEDLEKEMDSYIKANFTIDKEQLDRFGLDEKDYMYSMDKSDMLKMIRYFTNNYKVPASNDLEDAAKLCVSDSLCITNEEDWDDAAVDALNIFKAGAQWQKEHS